MYKKILIIIPIIFSSLTFAENLKLPTSYSNDLYNEIILSGDYDKKIDHPSKFLDFNYGDRVASPSQIHNAINTYKQQSNKIKLVNYGTTHEGRPLHALIISSPDNIAQLDTIKENLSALSDGRTTNEERQKKLLILFQL